MKKCERVNKPKLKLNLNPPCFILHTSYFILNYFLPYTNHITLTILHTILISLTYILLSTTLTRSILPYSSFTLYSLTTYYTLPYTLSLFPHSHYTSKSTLLIYVLQDPKFLSYYLIIIHT